MSSTNTLSKRLLEVAAEFETSFQTERDSYRNAIDTLHDKIASLKTNLDLEKTRSKRQQELIDALQQQLRDSQLVGDLQSKERLLEQGKLLKEMESLRSEVLALRFQVLNQENVHKETKSSKNNNNDSGFDENNNPNAAVGKDRDVMHSERLVQAAESSDVELVKKLLNPDRSVVEKALDSYKDTLSMALNSAAGSENTDLSGATVDTVALLLTCGADPFYCNASKWNAIHRASFTGNDKVLEKLLSFSTQQQLTAHLESTVMEEQSTALHLAAKRGHGKCVKLLLRNGANIVAKDGKGLTAKELGIAHVTSLDALNDPGTVFWSHSVRANRLYSSEDYDGAREAYDQAIELIEKGANQDAHITSNTNRATLYYNSARACAKVGRHLEAITRCSSAIELRNGSYPNALSQRAASYMALFEYQRAVQDYEQLAQTNHGSEDWVAYLAKARELATKATDHYLCLGVSPDATGTQIKQAFRKQCLKWHPDKHRGSEDDMARASIMFKAINEANEVLSNEQKRTIYDIDRISKRMDDIVRRQAEEQYQWKQQEQPRKPKRTHHHNNQRYKYEFVSSSEDEDEDELHHTYQDDDDDLSFMDDDDEDFDDDEDEEEIFARPSAASSSHFYYSKRRARTEHKI